MRERETQTGDETVPVQPGERAVQVKLGSAAARVIDDEVLPIVFVPVGDDWADRMDEIEQLAGQVDDEFGDQRTNSNWVSLSPHGPTMQLEGADSVEDLRQWVSRFAELLTQAGFAGVIRVAREARVFARPAHISRYALCAFVGYTLAAPELQDRRVRWAVAPDLTEQVTEAATAWAVIPGGRVSLNQQVSSVEIAAEQVPAGMRFALRRDAATGITVQRKKPWRDAAAEFTYGGRAVYRLVDETYSWQDTVAAMQQAMLFAPAHTDLAFLRFASNHADSWTDLDPVNRMPVGVDEGAMRYNRHLWSRYTADANGVQLLTGAHLANARDLSDWDIEEVARDRYLVQTRNLEPWYASEHPDPEVLEQARRDFGGMIISRDVIRANRRPDQVVLGF